MATKKRHVKDLASGKNHVVDESTPCMERRGEFITAGEFAIEAPADETDRRVRPLSDIDDGQWVWLRSDDPGEQDTSDVLWWLTVVGRWAV